MSSKLTLTLATDICSSIVAKCKDKGWAPVCATVLDSSANIICVMRMDGVAVAYPKFSQAKATTCVSLGMSSRKFRDKYVGSDPVKLAQLHSMVACMDGRIAAFPGGVLMLPLGGSNEIVGAVGVSGASSDQDEWLALSAIRDCGYEGLTEPAESPLD